MEKEVVRKFKDMSQDERKKLIQVLREKESGSNDKVEWIYKEHNVDSEEYLLGRRIDKGVTDNIFEEPAASTDSPGSLFNEVIARRSQLDMQVKMREDPLYAIKQKEDEMRKRVLENPLKVKKLKAIIESEKMSKNHYKKTKKRKRSGERSSSSSSDEEANELLQRYLSIKKMKSENNSEETNKTGKRDELESAKRKESTGHHKRNKGKHGAEHDKDERREKHSRSHHHRTRCSDEEDDKHKHRKFGLEIKSSGRHDQYIRSEKVDYSNVDIKKPTVQDIPRSKKKLTEKEKEELRRQMQSDAKERDVQRHDNVKRYKEEDKQETEETNDRDKCRFIEPMAMIMASSTSVEDRIKSKRHTVQRTKDEYNKNFARR